MLLTSTNSARSLGGCEIVFEDGAGADANLGGSRSSLPYTNEDPLEQNSHRIGEVADTMPCLSIASYELDIMKWNQRRHISIIEQNAPAAKKRAENIPLPSVQSFPRDCLDIIRLLDRNDACVDCGQGGGYADCDGSAKGGNPMWASISHGTLLCDKCAFIHITRSEEKQFKHMSHVKHLETGYWSLPEVLQMLEGGNGNFLQAVQTNRSSRRGSLQSGASERRSSQRLTRLASLDGRSSLDGLNLNPIQEEEEDGNAAFDSRYKSKAAAAYCSMLTRRTEEVCGAFECDKGLPYEVAQDMMGTDFFQRPVPVPVFQPRAPANVSQSQPSQQFDYEERIDQNPDAFSAIPEKVLTIATRSAERRSSEGSLSRRKNVESSSSERISYVESNRRDGEQISFPRRRSDGSVGKRLTPVYSEKRRLSAPV